MKKLILALIIALPATGFAQKLLPEIKKGTQLNYVVRGQNDIYINLTYDSISADFVRIGWELDGFGAGNWVMKKNSLENGNRGSWDEPINGGDMELADEQTLLLVSKAQWNKLKSDGKMEYDMQNYSLASAGEEEEIKLDGKALDVLMLKGENGQSKMWVLNNPDLPVILKISANTLGPDVEVLSIK